MNVRYIMHSPLCVCVYVFSVHKSKVDIGENLKDTNMHCLLLFFFFFFFRVCQLQNGGLKLEPLSASLVRSVAAVTAQASVAMVTSLSMAIPADVHTETCPALSRTPTPAAPPNLLLPNQSPHEKPPAFERGVRYFSLTESGEHVPPETCSPPPSEGLIHPAQGKGLAARVSANEQKQEEDHGCRLGLGERGEPRPPHVFNQRTHTHTVTHTFSHTQGEREAGLNNQREREQESEHDRVRQQDWERGKDKILVSQGYPSPDAVQTEHSRVVASGKGLGGKGEGMGVYMKKERKLQGSAGDLNVSLLYLMCMLHSVSHLVACPCAEPISDWVK